MNRIPDLSETLVVLQVNAIVQVQYALDLLDALWLGFEDVVNVMSAVEVAGVVGELASAKLLDLVHFGTIAFHFLRYGRNKVVQTIFLALGV